MKRKINRIRKFKYYFYKYGIHKILPGDKLIFLGHLSRLSKWISENKGLGFSNFPTKNFDYQDRFKLFQYVIDKEIKDEAVDYLEFGVSTGASFRWWAEHLKNPNTRLFGFDTFTGLPEDWGPFKAGAMSNGNKPPEMNDSRCTFYQGIFQKTLYDFLKTYQSDKKKIIHLDADLYSATLFVLTMMSPYLNKGDIIFFDEFNVPMHEYKALKEWTEAFYPEYEVLGEVNNYYQLAIKVTRMN